MCLECGKSLGGLPLEPKPARQGWAVLNNQRRTTMLWTICVILTILWLLGFSLHVGGGLIHLLLVVALVMVVINLLSGRRTAV
jgi:hypothetical protein